MRIIVYVLLGLLLAVSGYAATQFIINSQRADKISALEDRVIAAESTLRGIKSATAVSDAVSLQLSDALTAIGQRSTGVTERIYTMERDNVEVRDFLSTPLPDSGCLLDDSCDAPIFAAGSVVTGALHAPGDPKSASSARPAAKQ